MSRLCRSRFTASGIEVELYSSGGALVAVHLGGGASEKLARWRARHFGEAETEPAGEAHRDFEHQFVEYFERRRRVFDLPLELHGTPFQKEVWRAVGDIPYGRTTTYGAIAHLVGRPEASRAVGAANGKNPLPVVIPCHRVVGASGALTGYGGGLPLKRRLLAMEGALPSPAVQMRLQWRPTGGETR